MSKQKFHKGDRVLIAKDLGVSMSHFTSGKEAIVLYTHAEKFGSKDTKFYALNIDGEGFSAWYREHQLTLIKAYEDPKDVRIAKLEKALTAIFNDPHELNGPHTVKAMEAMAK